MTHILERKAKITKVGNVTASEDSTYDTVAGLWRNKDQGIAAYDPGNDRVSKKMDVETGEDLKGQ